MPTAVSTPAGSSDGGEDIFASPYVPEEDSDYVPDDDENAVDEDEDDMMDEDEDEDGEEVDIHPRVQDVLQELMEASESEGDGFSGGGAASTLLSLFRAYSQRRRRDRSELASTFEVPNSDDEDPAGWSNRLGKYKDSRVADPRGVEVLKSGEFGPVADRRHRSAWDFIQKKRSGLRHMTADSLYRDYVPNTNGTVVASYRSKAYVGQFSTDSSIYYTCTQDFDLHVYDANAPITPPDSFASGRSIRHTTSMKVNRSILGMGGHWTVTDSHLSSDNSSLIYSSLDSTVHLIKLQDVQPTPISLRVAGTYRDEGHWYGGDPAIYSCRFSMDGKEIVAGGSGGGLYVYDLQAMRRSLRIAAHNDDINSCCWADTASGNVLVSASDDSSLKVWDRRSFGESQKPSGVLIGHTEGITHVGPKGDGRYVISNGKDQVLRLWDLRKMRTHHEWDGGRNPYGHHGYDYRGGHYPRPKHKAHPLDTSVMAYKGHAVLRTLIRCHFSPAESTGSSYIYSGSYDGRIHIWSLDGRVVQVLDRSKPLPMTFHPSEPDMAPTRTRGANVCVRDVSWQSTEPVMMSCAWESEVHSSVARHEWKGFGKHALTVEDVVERDTLESQERGPGAMRRRVLAQLLDM